MHRLKRATQGLAVLVLALTVAACDTLPSAGAATARPGGKLVPQTGAYLGTFTSSGTWSGNEAYFNHFQSREGVIGRKFDIAHHFYGWSNQIPSGLEQWDIAGGRIPMVTWQPSVGLDAINDGSQDWRIRWVADGLKSLNTEVFLRWGHEMNGNWYPWDGYHNNDPGTTNGPAKYVSAWRRVHDIFQAQGATKVVWVWEPGASNIPNEPWNHWRNYYPGDEYVDWVGIDGYNWGPRFWPYWTSFEAKFAPVYDDYASRKPIMIAETSSVDEGGDKGQWIRDAMASMKTRFPSIAALVWFDEKKEADWRFDSSATARSAFRVLAADPYFNPRTPATSLSVRFSTVKGGPTEALGGAEIGGDAWISVTSTKSLKQVRFYLDNPTMAGTPTTVENYAPWDLYGGAGALNVAGLPGWNHKMTVAADLWDGSTEVTTVPFFRR